jgi:hypothetical protein
MVYSANPGKSTVPGFFVFSKNGVELYRILFYYPHYYPQSERVFWRHKKASGKPGGCIGKP